MGRFFGMIMRVAAWGASGAVGGYIGVLVYELAFTGGALMMTSTHAIQGASVGAVAFAVIGFFKRA